jgi:hypothetical protein
VQVLEDHQPGHQPCRQRRLAGPGAARASETVVEERPVDPRRQPDQRMLHVDDLVERRAKQIRLPIIPRLRHRPSPNAPQKGITLRRKPEIPNRRKSTPLTSIPANRVTSTDPKTNLDQ